MSGAVEEAAEPGVRGMPSNLNCGLVLTTCRGVVFDVAAGRTVGVIVVAVFVVVLVPHKELLSLLDTVFVGVI